MWLKSHVISAALYAEQNFFSLIQVLPDFNPKNKPNFFIIFHFRSQETDRS